MVLTRVHQWIHRRGLSRLLPWLLAGVGLGAYANSLDGPFIYDDAVAIVENGSIRQLWPPRDVLSPPAGTPVAGRPLVNLTLAANYRIGGLDVRGYHAFNVAVHVLCGLLVFGIVRRTLAGDPQGGLGDAAPALAGACALLWMVHPIQTECVNYITQRSESVMALFFLLTLYCAIRAASAGRPLPWSVASVVSCALGMASKETMVAAPVMVALYDWAYRNEPYGTLWRRRRGLYAGLAATWIALALLMAGGPRAGTVGYGHGIGGWEYALNQCVAIADYLKLVVWPDPLILDHGYPQRLSIGDVLPLVIVLASLVAATVVLFIRRPRLGFPVLWFLMILAPTSSIVPIATEVAAERRMYLPLAGLIVFVVAASYALLAAAAKRPRPAGVLLVGAILAAAPLIVVTWRRNALYRDPVAMWEASTQAVPGNHRARTNLGIALATGGRLDEAINQFVVSLRIEPDGTRTNYNLANALAAQGRLDEAIARYRTVLAAEPNAAEAHHNLGIALGRQGNLDGALRHYRAGVRLKPRDAEGRHNLGKALALAGQAPEALGHLKQAVQMQPGWAAPARDAAWILATWPAADVRDGSEAVRLAERAAALTARGDSRTLDALAAAYAEVGRFDDAAATAREALALAEAAGDAGLAGGIRARLALYRRHTPYRVPKAEP
ncbi:MAG: tetratricopeptide repeat protein [Planctomycetota bacterium]|jgi:tetratricopeptide (TPR) repeat protein